MDVVMNTGMGSLSTSIKGRVQMSLGADLDHQVVYWLQNKVNNTL